MQTLFPLHPVWPDGFQYHPRFLTVEETLYWTDIVRSFPTHPFRFGGYEAHRRVASFGFDYNFEKGSLLKGEAIPPLFFPLMKKVASQLGLAQDSFSELLITEYPPGSVINWHRDAPPFEHIAGISLAAPCTFKLRPYDATLRKSKRTQSVLLDSGSLYLLSGAARSEWQHSIAPVKATRYSVTLRTLRGDENKQAM